MRPRRIDTMGDHQPGQFTPARDRPLGIRPDAPAFTGESPARALQEALSSRISDGFALDAEEHVERWPRHERLLFLIGSAAGLWAVTIGLAALATALIR